MLIRQAPGQLASAIVIALSTPAVTASGMFSPWVTERRHNPTFGLNPQDSLVEHNNVQTL
jgi:hypothetical protein